MPAAERMTSLPSWSEPWRQEHDLIVQLTLPATADHVYKGLD